MKKLASGFLVGCIGIAATLRYLFEVEQRAIHRERTAP